MFPYYLSTLCLTLSFNLLGQPATHPPAGSSDTYTNPRAYCPDAEEAFKALEKKIKTGQRISASDYVSNMFLAIAEAPELEKRKDFNKVALCRLLRDESTAVQISGTPSLGPLSLLTPACS